MSRLSQMFLLSVCLCYVLHHDLTNANNVNLRATKSRTSKLLELSEETLRQKIDAFVFSILRCNKIPGVNLAIVRNGKIFMAEGYGMRNLETKEPFTNTTKVLIASLTKAFVSTLIATALQQNNNVTWDTPVRAIIGDWFVLNDALRTEKLTLRDLLSHRSGLPRNDPLLLSGYNAKEMLEHMRYLTFTQDWRESAKYNNLMYGVAGYVLEALYGGQGLQWEDVAQRTLLDPLSMRSTTFVHRHRADSDWADFAKAYAEDDNGRFRSLSPKIASLYYETLSAPGSLSSTAEDMAKWLAFNVNDGVNEQGEQVVSAHLLSQLHTPSSLLSNGVVMSQPQFPVTYTQDKYGLGWLEGYYNGYAISQHSGNQAGFASMITLVPHLKAGIYSTFNRDDVYIRDLLHVFIMELLLGNEPWLSEDSVCNGHIVRSLERSRKDRRLSGGGSSPRTDDVRSSSSSTALRPGDNDGFRRLIGDVLEAANRSDLLNGTNSITSFLNAEYRDGDDFYHTISTLIPKIRDAKATAKSDSDALGHRNANVSEPLLARLLSSSGTSRSPAVQPSKRVAAPLARERMRKDTSSSARGGGGVRSRSSGYSLQASVIRRRQQQQQEAERQLAAMRLYEGTYGHLAYGNISVTLDDSGRLVLSYGRRGASWVLIPVVERLFQAVGREPFWYWTMVVVFDMRDDGRADQLYVPFEREDITIFRRDLVVHAQQATAAETVAMATVDRPTSSCTT